MSKKMVVAGDNNDNDTCYAFHDNGDNKHFRK